ncbi:hypothetical protein OIU76_021386 [Salix suchowensis]|nr:hypothetical protein OIU76_021386 [Salix suchowensis]
MLLYLEFSLQALKSGVLMAGLQYYFFPTDFNYPRPPPANEESVSSPALHLQPQKGGTEDHHAMNQHQLDLTNQPQLSASTAVVHSPCIIKSETRRTRRSNIAP